MFGKRHWSHTFLRKAITLSLITTISPTSLIVQIRESIIKGKILEHMVKSNLLTPFQHGFIAGRSFVT